jgi:predicted transcriptional regulator
MARKNVHSRYLGELETAVLEWLWDHGAATAKDVHGGMGRDISLNTVQSTLERLAKKQIARREKVSHAFVYAAAVTRGELMAHLIENAVDELAVGHPEAMLSAFVDLTERTDEAALDRLERLIAQRKAQRD